jgi:hypothetical protein
LNYRELKSAFISSSSIYTSKTRNLKQTEIKQFSTKKRKSSITGTIKLSPDAAEVDGAGPPELDLL